MYSLYPLFLLLVWPFPSSQISIDLNYEELKELDATCDFLDSCNVRRSSDSLVKHTCQCGSYCSQLGTCCIDSPFRDRSPAGRRQTCRPVNGEQEAKYFMVDQCSSRNRDSEMEKRCRKDWNKEDDIQPLIPVTSVSSNVTYKNYFCLRCNEATNNFVYWDVRVKYNVTPEADYEKAIPTFDTSRQTWMALINDNDFVPVDLEFEIPTDIRMVPNLCITNAISSCSGQWNIRDVKRKCSMYTSYIHIVKNGNKAIYRNPHCALCNFENLEHFGCGITFSRTVDKKPFSFTNLLDIDLRDGDLVGKVELCDSKSIFDPFFKKCRRHMCAMPGYVLKEGKCAPP